MENRAIKAVTMSSLTVQGFLLQMGNVLSLLSKGRLWNFVQSLGCLLITTLLRLRCLQAVLGRVL